MAWHGRLMQSLKANEHLGPVSKFFQLATIRQNNKPGLCAVTFAAEHAAR